MEPEVDEQNIEEEQKELTEEELKEIAYRQSLIDFEKWGALKRWGDINFCRRLRNMRSHLLFGMDLKTLEKSNEQKWHLDEGRHKTASQI
jgi:hypothetical protein